MELFHIFLFLKFHNVWNCSMCLIYNFQSIFSSTFSHFSYTKKGQFYERRQLLLRLYLRHGAGYRLRHPCSVFH